jgi:serine protease Do
MSVVNHLQSLAVGKLTVIAAVLALFAASCGAEPQAETHSAGGATTITVQIPADNDEADEPEVSDDSVPMDPDATAVSTLEDAAAAVIQVQATGGFVYPDTGEIEGVGRGSGFFISPDGVAVTNNHVVGGAAFLEVFIGGDPDPVRARVLGVDECTDLAVIKVDGRDDYPFLEFFEGESSVGTPVFAAGFPLGDPEYTLTSGIVSKASANGDTNWASVDAVLEHDARINPGNSGGPLITEDGKVVGINYAGRDDTDQNFAITGTDAVPLIDQMRAGSNVDSIGINGSVVAIGDVAGVWVSSMETGSPADTAGVEAGDFIVRVENISVGVEGTMRRYCESIRGQGAEREIAIEVLRPTTGEILVGNINGPEKLEVAFGPEAGGEATVASGGTPYTDFVTLLDDTGQISLQVPAAWNQTRTEPLVTNGVTLAMIIASENIESVWVNGDFNTDEDAPLAPGLVMMGVDASGTSLTPAALLAGVEGDLAAECGELGAAEDFYIGSFEGFSQIATNCGTDGDASLLWLAAQDPVTGEMMILVLLLLTEADVRQVGTILASLEFH